MRDIVILTQDKKCLINYCNIAKISIRKVRDLDNTETWEIIAKTIRAEYPIVMGKYTTESECVKDFNRIFEEIRIKCEWIEV